MPTTSAVTPAGPARGNSPEATAAPPWIETMAAASRPTEAVIEGKTGVTARWGMLSNYAKTPHMGSVTEAVRAAPVGACDQRNL